VLRARHRLVFLSPAPLTSTRPYTCHLVPKIHSVRNRQPAVFGDDRWARRRRANRRLTAQTQTFPGHSSSPKGKGEGAQRLFLHGRYTSRLWLAILWAPEARGRETRGRPTPGHRPAIASLRSSGSLQPICRLVQKTRQMMRELGEERSEASRASSR